MNCMDGYSHNVKSSKNECSTSSLELSQAWIQLQKSVIDDNNFAIIPEAIFRIKI